MGYWEGAEMKVLITAGAGYIGSVLAEQLLARGEQVHVLDGLLHGGHCRLMTRRGANELSNRA